MGTKGIGRRDFIKGSLGTLLIASLAGYPSRAAETLTVLTHTAFLNGLGGEAGPNSLWARFAEQHGVNLQFVTQGTHSDLQAGFFREVSLNPSLTDVGVIKPDWFGKTQLELLEPLSGRLESDPIEDFDDFFPGLVEFGNFQGTQYFIPFMTGTWLLFIRQDLYDQFGMSPPQSMEELADQARFLHQNTPSDVFGFLVAGNKGQQWQFFKNWVGAFGQKSLIDDEGNPLLNTQAAVESFQLIVDLVREGVVPPNMTEFANAETINLWQQGKVATGIAFSSWFKQFNDPDSSTIVDAWSAHPWPGSDALKDQLDKQFGYMTTWMLGLARNSAKKDLGWELIKFLTSKEVMKQSAIDGGMQVSRVSVWNDPSVKKTLLTADATLQQLQKASFPWPLGTPNAVQILDVLGEEMQLAYLGRKSAREALDAANERAKELLTS